MNPARSAAPALVAGRLESLWIYIVGPLIGAAAAVAIAIVLHGIGPEDGEAEAAAQGAAGRQDR